MGLVIYWWNPLLVKEIYNSGHMDILIFPFVLGVLLFAIQRRHVLASASLGVAVGVKFWPVILLPIVLRPLLSEPKRLVSAILVFLTLSIAAFLPFLLSGLTSDSGFVAYGKHWEMNDTLYMLLLWLIQFVIRIFSLGAGYDQLVTRALVACFLLVWIFLLSKRVTHDPAEICRRFLLAIAALYLLSPTQFPWYSLWILPFLAICPRVSFLLLTPLLSLYYLRFYFNARGMVHIYDNGIVWLEFAPVWGLLIWEWCKEQRNSSATKTGRHNEGI